MNAEELKYEVDSILTPEPDEDGNYPWFMPDKRLSSVHNLDTSYFKGPYLIDGESAFERVLQDDSDPLHDTLQSTLVPDSLLLASLRLLGDSIIAYHAPKDSWGWYRYYPSILMTAWSAFESWVRIHSEILVAVAPALPSAVKEALLESRTAVSGSGQIEQRPDRRPVMDRYWLLLKHGCDLEFDRGGRVWQKAREAATVRDSVVHYNVSIAPSITASQAWEHVESIMLLLIAPSCQAKRTLFHRQYDAYSMLVQLREFITEFEERPFHKGWPRGPVIFNCPFNGVDEAKYPSRWKK